jgi:hypothetical protein
MTRIVGNPAVFILMMLFMTVVCTAVWERFCTDLYDCTDENLLGFLEPGFWVHGHIAYVPVVTHGRSMGEPDTIKEGWSTVKLMCLWLSFVVVSVIISIAVARLPWNQILSSSNVG